MITVRDLRGTQFELADVVPRAELDIDAALTTVQPIIDAVRTRGVAALDEYAEAFAQAMSAAYLAGNSDALAG